MTTKSSKSKCLSLSLSFLCPTSCFSLAPPVSTVTVTVTVTVAVSRLLSSPLSLSSSLSTCLVLAGAIQVNRLPVPLRTVSFVHVTIG